MTEYIRLAEAPQYSYSYPTCSACSVDLTHDGDEWMCPVCGSTWPSDATDGDTGTLYEEWSGESLGDAPALDESAASDAGYAYERAERKRAFVSWGWCEHGMPGECAHRDCPGGTARRADTNPD